MCRQQGTARIKAGSAAPSTSNSEVCGASLPSPLEQPNLLTLLLSLHHLQASEEDVVIEYVSAPMEFGGEQEEPDAVEEDQYGGLGLGAGGGLGFSGGLGFTKPKVRVCVCQPRRGAS